MPRRCSSTCSCRFRVATIERPLARRMRAPAMSPTRSSPVPPTRGRCTVGSCRRREQPHARARLPQRHRRVVRTLAHARPPAGIAALPRRADAGERRRAARRVPDDERVRRSVSRPHRSHAGPLFPVAGGCVTPEASHGRRPGRGPRRASRLAASARASLARDANDGFEFDDEPQALSGQSRGCVLAE